MRLLDIVYQQYNRETERRDKLNAASSIPIGFATLSIATLSSGINQIERPFNCIEIVALVLFLVALVCAIVFAYHAVRFFLGPVYKYAATADAIKQYHGQQKDYYAKYPEAGSSDVKFEEFLVETHAKCATINCENNDEKSNRLYIMNRWVLAVLIACVIGTGLLTAQKVFSPREEQGQIVMTNNSNGNGQRPPPPPPPPERSVKDGANVPSKK